MWDLRPDNPEFVWNNAWYKQVKEDENLKDKNKYFLRTIKTYKKNVQPAYLQYIEPTKAYADLIINSEIDKWSKVIQLANIKPD